MTRVVVDGIDEFNEELKKFAEEANKDMQTMLSWAAVETHKTAVINIQTGARSGASYKRGGKIGQRSAAGEFPKSDTGRLARNITIKTDSSEYGKNLIPAPPLILSNSLDYTVGSRKDAPHGYHLEFKSPLKGGRPWLSRSFNIMKDKFDAEVQKRFKK